MKRIFCLLLAMGLMSAAFAQAPYRWKDKAGRVHYTDHPPPAEIEQVDSLNLKDNSIQTSGASFATRRAVQHFPVTLYTAPNCVQACLLARELLNGRGVPFSELVINTQEDKDAYTKRFGIAEAQVPTLAVGSQKTVGFEAGAWNDLLDAANYPRSGGVRAPLSPAGPASSEAPHSPHSPQSPQETGQPGNIAEPGQAN